MNRPARWFLVAGIGLACAAAALAVLFAIGPDPDSPGPRVESPVGASGPEAPQVAAPVSPLPPAAPLPEGPPMRIDDGDLVGAGRERADNDLGMAFCWCPPGSFHMGRLPDGLSRYQDAKPVAVTLSRGFWMGKFEVTQSQWQRVMGLSLREQRAKDHRQPRPVGDGTTREHVGEGPDHPIYFVGHDEAEEFCRRLTVAEREAGRLEDGWEYRLPTEAQWEFACRAGTTTATSFGDRFGGEQVNFDGTKPLRGTPPGPYLRETTPVGRYPANPWGLHDMHGNVWEWCRDGYVEAPKGGTDPMVEPTPEQLVYRGGCWHNPGSLCLSTSRGRGPVDNRGSGVGFRVALVPNGSGTHAASP